MYNNLQNLPVLEASRGRFDSGHRGMDETWKSVPGYEGLYEVSDRGRVRSLDRIVHRKDGRTRRSAGRVLKAHPYDRYGHVHVSLYDLQGGRKNVPVHYLVLGAFVGPRPEGLDICHSNRQSEDNRLCNLRYDTRSANVRDYYRPTS